MLCLRKNCSNACRLPSSRYRFSTNTHVLDKGMAWKIRSASKTSTAGATWIDPDHDLALLTVEGIDAAPVPIRLSPSPAVGERVYAIGNPEGLELTLSEGILSGLREFEGGYAIQTSAAMSQGASGGGLFDSEGRLIGITAMSLNQGQNLNFALPADWVGALLDIPRARHSPASRQDSDVLTQAASHRRMITSFEEMGGLPYPPFRAGYVPPDRQGKFGFGSVWTWVAIDADTELIPSFTVGNRDAASARMLIEDLASRLKTRIQLTTDGLRAYAEAVEGAFGCDVDYAMLIKNLRIEPRGNTLQPCRMHIM